MKIVSFSPLITPLVRGVAPASQQVRPLLLHAQASSSGGIICLEALRIPKHEINRTQGSQRGAAGQRAGSLSMLNSTWGLRASVSQSPVHHAVGTLDGGSQDISGDAAGARGGDVTLTRLRTPLSTARHQQRQQRWLDMGEQLSVHPLPSQEQVRSRAASPDSCLNMETVHLPSDAPFGRSDVGCVGIGQAWDT